MIDDDILNALIALVEDARSRVSNVHDSHYELNAALLHLKEAAKPCECEYCQADRKKVAEFTI